MRATKIQITEPSTDLTQIFKPDSSKLIALTQEMITSGEIKTTLDFAKKFMFCFDSDKKFPINIDLLVEMKVYDEKGHTKKKLKKHFLEQVDFIIEKVACKISQANLQNSHGGQNKEHIFLTVDCFKSLCLLANSEMGKQTKRYYLDLEKVFKKYIVLEFEEKQLQMKQENAKLLQLHNSSLMRHSYFKFDKGPSFYILLGPEQVFGNLTSRLVKIGIAGCTKPALPTSAAPIVCPNCSECIDNTNASSAPAKKETYSLDSRLAEHRTLWPFLEVVFIAYTSDASLLEKNLKRYYRDQINPTGHELIYGVSAEDIKLRALEFLKVFNARSTENQFKIASNEDILKYNEIANSHMKNTRNLLLNDLQTERALIEDVVEVETLEKKEMEEERGDCESKIDVVQEKLEIVEAEIEVVQEKLVEKVEEKREIDFEKYKYQEQKTNLDGKINHLDSEIKKRKEEKELYERIIAVLQKLPNTIGKDLDNLIREFRIIVNRPRKELKVADKKEIIATSLNKLKETLNKEEKKVAFFEKAGVCVSEIESEDDIDTELCNNFELSFTETKEELLQIAEKFGLACGLCSTKEILTQRIVSYLSSHKVLVDYQDKYFKCCEDCKTKKELVAENFAPEFRSLKLNEPPTKLGFALKCNVCMRAKLEVPKDRVIVNTKEAKSKLAADEKLCGRCCTVKKKTDFAFNKGKKDGYNPMCKQCNALRLRESRAKDSLSALVQKFGTNGAPKV